MAVKTSFDGSKNSNSARNSAWPEVAVKIYFDGSKKSVVTYLPRNRRVLESTKSHGQGPIMIPRAGTPDLQTIQTWRFIENPNRSNIYLFYMFPYVNLHYVKFCGSLLQALSGWDCNVKTRFTIGSKPTVAVFIKLGSKSTDDLLDPNLLLIYSALLDY